MLYFKLIHYCSEYNCHDWDSKWTPLKCLGPQIRHHSQKLAPTVDTVDTFGLQIWNKRENHDFSPINYVPATTYRKILEHDDRVPLGGGVTMKM